MTKFFSADLHFFHSKILSMTSRGDYFNSIEEHDDYLIEKINKKVGRADELFILGDFCFYKHPRIYRQKINCKHIWLIFGNHDYQNGPSKFIETFGSQRCCQYKETKLYNGTFAFCIHYPCIYWPKSHYQSINLYGHIHNGHQNTIYGAFPEMLSLDVGVDSAKEKIGEFEPFSEYEVVDLLKNRKGHHEIVKRQGEL